MSSASYTWLVRKATTQAPPQVPLPDDKAFGKRLQEIRKRRGLSQVEVADRLGIHQSLISQYERGYLRLHGALLVRLAEALKTTPDEILAVKKARGNGDDQTLDRRFVRRLRKIDKLTAHEKKLLLGTIDAFLSKVS
jgi:transcriptional regulator with XRE-family HTH domain